MIVINSHFIIRLATENDSCRGYYLALADLVEGQIILLARLGIEHGDPAWSRDGNRIALIDKDGLLVVRFAFARNETP